MEYWLNVATVLCVFVVLVAVISTSLEGMIRAL